MTGLDRRGAFVAGLTARAPCCGAAPLFNGFLSVAPLCRACGYPLGKSDSGDGPAVFVIIIVGFAVVFAALFTEVAVHPPIWVDLVLWLPLAGGLSLALLRPLKGLMIAIQIHHRAAEHRAGGA